MLHSYAPLNETERRQYYADLKAYRDYYATLNSAATEGRAEGRAKIIRTMFKIGMDIETISSMVDLSSTEVKDILKIN